MTGLTIITNANEERPATAFVADRHLGRTADKRRVVDYYSPEAAYNFRSPGKKVTAEEAALYGISAEHPYSPKGWPSSPAIAEGPAEAPPAEPEAKQAEPTEEETDVKAATKPADKAVKKDEVEDKSFFGRKKKKAQ